MGHYSRYVCTRSRSSEAHARLSDSERVPSTRTLAGQSGDLKRKREGGENGDRERKGGDRSQQQAAWRAADVEEKRAAGRAGDVEHKRKAGRAGDIDVKRVDSHEVLLRADGTVTTTMPPSLRRAMAAGSAQFATASRERTA